MQQEEQWIDLNQPSPTTNNDNSDNNDNNDNVFLWYISIHGVDFTEIESAIVKVKDTDTIKNVVLSYFGEYYDISYYRFGKFIENTFFEYDLNDFDIKTLKTDPKINNTIDILEKGF
jgi:hypothetical protein